jgi:hypothetical protein
MFKDIPVSLLVMPLVKQYENTTMKSKNSENCTLNQT